MTEAEKMMARQPYNALDPVMQDLFHVTQLKLEKFNTLGCMQAAETIAMMKELFAFVGEGAFIKGHFICTYGKHISLGEGAFINEDANFMDDNLITIGKNVMIGPGALLITANHPLRYEQRMFTDESGQRHCVSFSAPITIEEGAWLAARVTVCPGVTIGRGAVVGAGSVVTKDIPAGMLALGTPCRPVRPVE